MKKKNNLPLNFKEKNNSKISLICSVAVLILLCLLFQQMDYRMIRKPAQDAAKKAALEKQRQEEIENTPVISTASVIAVGDNLYHGSLIESGQYESGNWNYDHIYANVLDEIQAADIAMVDQETIFTDDHNAVSSYPSFATPTEVGDALVTAGFDVIESATNHVDDYGYDNMAITLDFWKTNYPDITLLGLHETQEEADTVQIREVNGIKIAFLNYVYGTNNSGAGEGREYMIDIFDKDQITSQIEKAKKESDCIIFVAQWGKEDETMPTEYQKQWATFLMQQGVDVLVGGHPHVLQPYGRLSDDEGNEMVIFYSLGNFVSTQQSLHGLLGGMAKFTIQKTELKGNTTIQILTPTIDPLVMHYNHENGDYSPYMLSDYTEELASQHSTRDIIGDEFTLANLRAEFDTIMSMNVEPSTKTNLLNVRFDWEGNMIDKTTGNVVEDTDSISAQEYLSGSEDGDGSEGDGTDYSGDSSYDSGYDTGYYDDYDSDYYDDYYN